MGFEFLAYSDIHHDDYKNGVMLEDTISIEDEITQYAIDLGIKQIFFIGDWFRATNPVQLVVKEAEASWVRRSHAGIITNVIVGNHDRFTRSEDSKHAFYAMPVFDQDLEHIHIYDESYSAYLEDQNIEIFMVPAGWQNKLPKRQHPEAPLVVMLHGMIHGSMLASGISANGIDPQPIKNLNPILVLAGDNHTPQTLPMFMSPSRYLGAPLQHNWGDRGQDRGFWHITINNGAAKCVKCNTHAPRFIRENIDANTEIESILGISNLLQSKLNGKPGIVECTLIGGNAGNINRRMVEDTIKSNFNIRQLKINITQANDKIEVVAGMSKLNQPEDKWAAYVISGNAPSVENMNIQMLSEMGKWALQEARKL